MNILNSSEKKKERKAELLKAFSNMVDYAAKESVQTIIIAGDMFDQNVISATTKNVVIGEITRHPDIDFYYIKGNHDKNNFLSEIDDIPENLYMFNEEWKTYELGENVYLTGAELTENNSGILYDKLTLEVGHFNIVTLHGQESMASQKDKTEIVSLKDLKNKNIDYLALGHIHSYKYQGLDNRGYYCYPGCLEARGFDETETHGFVVLNINGPERTFAAELKCMPIRSVHVLPVDITNLMTSTEIVDAVSNTLKNENCPASDLVKVELVGEVDIQCEKNLSFIEKQFEDEYYLFRLKDLTGFKVDYNQYRLDESLKGEFIRTVEADADLDDETKAEIIRIGIKALRGEEVE